MHLHQCVVNSRKTGPVFFIDDKYTWVSVSLDQLTLSLEKSLAEEVELHSGAHLQKIEAFQDEGTRCIYDVSTFYSIRSRPLP